MAEFPAPATPRRSRVRAFSLTLALVPALVVPLGLGAAAWADEPLEEGAIVTDVPAVQPDPAPPVDSGAAVEEAPPAEPAPVEPVAPPVEEAAPDPVTDEAAAVEQPEPGPSTQIDATEGAGTAPPASPATVGASAELAAGAIAPGATTEITFQVENAVVVNAVVVSAPQLVASLVDPSGRAWTFDTNETTKRLTVHPTSPSTGTWVLRLTNSGAVPVLASYETSFERSNVTLGLYTSASAPQILLGINPVVNGAGRSDLAPIARITGPTGAMVEQPMRPQVPGSTGYTVSFTDVVPGEYTALVWIVIDGVEYSSSAGVRVVAAETVPPTVRHTLEPASNSFGWNRRPVDIRLVGSDNPGGSGVWIIHYRLDGGEVVQRYGSDVTVRVTGDGGHELEYWASDAQGNVGEPRTATVRIDTIAPSVSIVAPMGGEEYTVGQEVVVDFSCDDDRSGVQQCVGTLADGELLDTSVAGEFEFTLHAIDRAGNVSPRTVHYRVVQPPVAPQVEVTVPEVPESGWFTSDVELELAAIDANGDAASIHWYFVEPVGMPDGVAHGDHAQITLSLSGVYRVQAWAVDAAGNEGERTGFTVRIDRDRPEISIDSPDDGEPALLPGQVLQGSVLTVEFECSDDHSGLVACEGSTADGERLPTDTPGEHELTVEARDAAGNTSERTVSYTVVTAAGAQPSPAPAGLASTGVEIWVSILLAGVLLAAGSLILVSRRAVGR